MTESEAIAALEDWLNTELQPPRAFMSRPGYDPGFQTPQDLSDWATPLAHSVARMSDEHCLWLSIPNGSSFAQGVAELARRRGQAEMYGPFVA